MTTPADDPRVAAGGKPVPVLGTLLRVKLGLVAGAAVLAMALGWFAMRRLSAALVAHDVKLDALGEPAHLLLSQPLLAIVPGGLAFLTALVGLIAPLPRSGRVAALLLATLFMVVAVGLLMAAMVQALGPMYEYRAL